MLAAPVYSAVVDDHGDTAATASYFAAGPILNAAGILESAADVDVFAFSTATGSVSFAITSENGFELRTELRNEAGDEVVSSTSALNLDVPAGRYFLMISGGNGAVRGSYVIDGTIVSPPSGVPPVAVATVNFSAGNAPLAVLFEASQSFDTDGIIAKYDWYFGDGTEATGAVVPHTYTEAGEYISVLTVTDNNGLTHTQQSVVNVSEDGFGTRPEVTSSRSSDFTSGAAILNGKSAPQVGAAGPAARRVLRVIEATMPVALTGSLAQHEADLRAEGWEVETIYTARRDPAKPFQHVQLAQNEIWPRIRATTNLHVFLIGRVPMPRSGYATHPDGHWDTKGAYASTLYYALPSEGWTDVKDNSSFAVKPNMINRPGDGKFDQDTAPGFRDSYGREIGGDALASVGFLDLSFGNPRTFNSTLSSDEFLIDRYQNYFVRLHGYRTGAWRPQTKVAHMAYNGLPWSGISEWAENTVGAENYQFFRTYTTTKTQTYSVEQFASFGVVIDFKVVPSTGICWTGRTNQWAVLDLYFGSYQIDFGTTRLTNPLMSGALATGCYSWSRWNLDGIYSGATLGEVWRQTVSGSIGNVYRVLYGDPTLVMQP